MTPELLTSWLLPLALSACALSGLAVIVVCVRGGWKHSITWAVVSFGLIGAMMLLSPKWSTFAFEWGEMKATLAELQKRNSLLLAENARYAEQIKDVSSIATATYSSAEDLVQTIKATRARVDWADFLPSSTQAYSVAVSPESDLFKKMIAQQAGSSADAVVKALEDNKWTLVKPATLTDLSETPANSIWITPMIEEYRSNGQKPQMQEDPMNPRMITPPLPK
jgi:hypothetical protein